MLRRRLQLTDHDSAVASIERTLTSDGFLLIPRSACFGFCGRESKFVAVQSVLFVRGEFDGLSAPGNGANPESCAGLL